MTREEAIEILRAESGDVSCHTVGVARWMEAIDMAISDLRQHECVGEANKALTLDELRKMDGEPVWVVWPDLRIHSQWFIVGSVFWIEMFVEDDGTLLSGYGNRWIAYRQKPEEDDHE